MENPQTHRSPKVEEVTVSQDYGTNTILVTYFGEYPEATVNSYLNQGWKVDEHTIPDQCKGLDNPGCIYLSK